MKYSNSIIDSEYFHIIAESKRFVLGNEWEYAMLYNKETQEVFDLGWFYGDPQCGIVSDDNWCVVGGDIVSVWKNNITKVIESEELVWAFDIRLKDRSKVEILTDPWSEKSAIWEFNITDLTCKKIADFPYYFNKPYQDNVLW